MALRTTFPETEAEIKEELDNVQELLSTYASDPAKFAELMGGSVKVSIPDYLKFLREYQKQLFDRLKDSPWIIESDMVY